MYNIFFIQVNKYFIQINEHAAYDLTPYGNLVSLLRYDFAYMPDRSEKLRTMTHYQITRNNETINAIEIFFDNKLDHRYTK